MLSGCAIGIDIGGTYTKAGLVAIDGTVGGLVRFPTASHVDPTEYLNRLRALVADWSKETPLGIGLSLPGFHAADGRSIQFNPNTPSLVGVDFVSLFEASRLSVRIEQDLNTPALSEYAFGGGRGSKRFMAATLGTGAGVGVILGGELLRFTGNCAGDTGHIILEPDGPACQVGCHGCAEALVTIPAVEREARARRSQQTALDPASPVSSLDSVTAREVIEAARAGDPMSVDIMRLIGRRIGQWLACLAPIFLPDRIALCGGIVEAGAPTLDACRERFLQLTAADYANCEIVLGRFRELAGIVGAAVPFLTDGHGASPA
jgi:glucokinase